MEGSIQRASGRDSTYRDIIKKLLLSGANLNHSKADMTVFDMVCDSDKLDDFFQICMECMLDLDMVIATKTTKMHINFNNKTKKTNHINQTIAFWIEQLGNEKTKKLYEDYHKKMLKLTGDCETTFLNITNKLGEKNTNFTSELKTFFNIKKTLSKTDKIIRERIKAQCGNAHFKILLSKILDIKESSPEKTKIMIRQLKEGYTKLFKENPPQVRNMNYMALFCHLFNEQHIVEQWCQYFIKKFLHEHSSVLALADQKETEIFLIGHFLLKEKDIPLSWIEKENLDNIYLEIYNKNKDNFESIMKNMKILYEINKEIENEDQQFLIDNEENEQKIKAEKIRLTVEAAKRNYEKQKKFSSQLQQNQNVYTPDTREQQSAENQDEEKKLSLIDEIFKLLEEKQTEEIFRALVLHNYLENTYKTGVSGILNGKTFEENMPTRILDQTEWSELINQFSTKFEELDLDEKMKIHARILVLENQYRSLSPKMPSILHEDKMMTIITNMSSIKDEDIVIEPAAPETEVPPINEENLETILGPKSTQGSNYPENWNKLSIRARFDLIETEPFSEELLHQWLNMIDIILYKKHDKRYSQGYCFSRAVYGLKKMTQQHQATVLGTLHTKRSEWMKKWFNQTLPLLKTFNDQELANSFFALAKLKISPPREWMNHFLKIMNSRLDSFTYPGFTQLHYALKQFNIPASAKFMGTKDAAREKMSLGNLDFNFNTPVIEGIPIIPVHPHQFYLCNDVCTVFINGIFYVTFPTPNGQLGIYVSTNTGPVFYIIMQIL